MISYDELESFLTVNEQNFDEAAVNQPVLFQCACTILVDKWQMFKLQEIAVEKHEADVELELRRIIKDTGEKTTEPQIKAKVLASPTVVSAKTLLVQLEAEYKKLAFLRQAYEMRGDTIRVVSQAVFTGFRQY